MADIVPGLGSPPPDASPALDFVPELPPAHHLVVKMACTGHPHTTLSQSPMPSTMNTTALGFVPESPPALSSRRDGNSKYDDDMHSRRHTTVPRSPTPTTMNTVDLHMGVPFMY